MSSSDTDEDNPIRYGTPLEPYEEDELPSKRKYQQPTDQYAVDAHGRRRFHGAFTGGFSAGFGNTVGSQEGWTPSTFKSSRSEKAQSSSQRPEDFMDDEDRSEYGIAPKYMQTQSDFSGHKRTRQTFHDGPIPGEPVLGQLLKAVHETAAVRILRDMGWRPGQGTGDRVTRKEKRKAKDQQKVYGCYIPEELRQPEQSQDQESDHSSDSEFEYDTLFAPDDYEPYILHRKSDRFGLGYQGLSRHSVLGTMVGEYGESSTKSHLKMKDKGKKVSIRGQAFGVGAFEADDEDIYAKEDMSHYDFALGGPPPETNKKNNKDKGNNVLEGFVRATKPMPPVPSYPPPALPRDYTPAAAGARRTRFAPTDDAPRDQGLGRHELTAEARGTLLGEPPKPQQTEIKTNNTKEDLIAKIIGRNVDFVSTNTIENIDVIKDKNSAKEVSLNNTASSTSTNLTLLDHKLPEKIIDLTKPTSNTPDFISIKDSGKDLVNVFKPFASNPAKQARYENYLKDNNSLLERDGEIDRLNEWEREREFMEFEQAAKLYRPLTGFMGDRFTHASEPDDSTNPLTAVSKSKSNYGLATPEQIAAAEKGVYGVMTRTRIAWRPESIVCKRFNVPEPGGIRSEPKKEDKPKVSYSIFSYLESSIHDKDSFAKEQSKFSGSKSQRDIPKTDPKSLQTTMTAQSDNKIDNTVNKTDVTDNYVNSETSNSNKNEGSFRKRMTTAELFLKESEKTKEKGQEVTETIDKFDKMDLYKSIFLSDSEEESNDGGLTISAGFSIIDDFVDTPKNIERNTSPPRGIFANIDFDELNSWRRNVDKTELSQEKTIDKKSDTVAKEKEFMDVDEVYGPKIPEIIQKRLQSNDLPQINSVKVDSEMVSHKNRDVVEVDSSSTDSWVDAKEVKKKKSKHKKKKSKQKKSKHKKKER